MQGVPDQSDKLDKEDSNKESVRFFLFYLILTLIVAFQPCRSSS